jgi:signal transduction histidine kinase
MTHFLSETYTAAFDVRAKPRTALPLEGTRLDPESRELDWRVAASQALLEAAPDCVVIFDRDLRVVHFAAGRFQRRGDGRRRMVVGKVIAELPMFSSEEMRRAATQAVAGRRNQIRVRLVVAPKDPPATFDVRFGPVHDQHGRISGAAAVLRDISQEQQTEEALRQAQKSEALGQIAIGVAHDLNNLLTVVSARLEMLAQVDQGAPVQAHVVADASAAAQRGIELLRRLLAVGRRSLPVLQALDANQVIRDLLQLLRHSLPPSVALATELADGLAPAWADRSQLETALLNLVLNAREAMPGGGRLVIRTASVSDEDAPLVSISVEDDGCGMTPEVRRRAFEPFFSTKPVGQGTGLGLMMVERFAREAGGRVELETSLGHGTAVRLLLPRATTE